MTKNCPSSPPGELRHGAGSLCYATAMRYLALLTVALLALTWGCRRAPEKRAPATPRQPQPSPHLPTLVAPRLPAAERIVDLFYTANVGAEAEPCG